MPDDQATPVVGRRERKKLETHRALEAAAWALFHAQGFEATTIDDIAEAADVSPRTFFRYFPSKEAILFPEREQVAARFRDMLVGRPADESPLDAVRHALRALGDDFGRRTDAAVMRRQLQVDDPDITAFRRDVLQCDIFSVIVEITADRLGVDPEHDLRPRLVAGTAMAVIDAATTVWAVSDDQVELADLVEQGFGMLDRP